MFAAGEPLGILIGAALAIVLEGTAGKVGVLLALAFSADLTISLPADNYKLLTAVCAALASGTFVYVAIIDILLGEFETFKDSTYSHTP